MWTTLSLLVYCKCESTFQFCAIISSILCRDPFSTAKCDQTIEHEHSQLCHLDMTSTDKCYNSCSCSGTPTQDDNPVVQPVFQLPTGFGKGHRHSAAPMPYPPSQGEDSFQMNIAAKCLESDYLSTSIISTSKEEATNWPWYKMKVTYLTGCETILTHTQLPLMMVWGITIKKTGSVRDLSGCVVVSATLVSDRFGLVHQHEVSS